MHYVEHDKRHNEEVKRFRCDDAPILIAFGVFSVVRLIHKVKFALLFNNHLLDVDPN